MGEEICACIRVRAGQNCTEEEIKAFCKGKVGLPLCPVIQSLTDQYTQWVVPAGLATLFWQVV